MALSTPTTKGIADNITAQVEAAVSQTIPLFPKAFTRVLAKVLGGVFVLLFKYGGFMWLQIYVAYATMKETEVNGRTIRPLVELGRQIGVGDPIAAVRAELLITVTVENQTGDLPGGSQLLCGATGVVYQTTSATPLDADTIQVTVIASSDPDGGGGAGTIGNVAVGAVLSFPQPLNNVATDAIVTSATVVGVDGETEDEYRARVLKRTQGKPQGGAYADYRVWGESVPGVANVYPYTGLPGEVDVFVEATTDQDPDGIPSDDLIAAVAAAIELDVDGRASRRPVGAKVNVKKITRSSFTVAVGGLEVFSGAVLSSVQADISEGLDEFLRAREPYLVGLSVLPRKDRITTGGVGGVVNEIASAAGGTVTVVQLLAGSVAIPNHTLAKGEKAKLGAVTFG